jgi:predicted nucleic acid-binding protein
MRAVFADTYYFLALLNPSDAAHSRAAAFTRNYRERMVTTFWVLTELADALARPGSRSVAGRFIEALPQNRAMQIMSADSEMFNAGLALYLARPDKGWSLTDCVSFVVMQREGIHEALTGDHHFVQAGFVALLK